ncbi:MAG: lytic transglycosylase, partial [Alphaproteobacteria bacterium]
IRADRGQKSFKLTLDEFLRKRGASTIVSRGKKMKAQNAALFASIEKRYGVPAGPLIAIWGMETGFGSFMGKEHTLSAVATLSFDCRRTEYFTDQFMAALKLVERGDLSINAKGAAHGEIGQTQFLPKNVLKYGVDGDGNGHVDMVGSRADALASTANFLRGHGWSAGAGYQPGEANYGAIQGWNAAKVYQQAIALMGAQIDGVSQ